MSFLAISTFNAEGRRLYGDRMIDSFYRHWPNAVPLRVYAEGWRIETHKASIVDLLASSPWLAEFKARHAHRAFKDYRYDAVRFAHKVAAVCHAAKETHFSHVIWLDGDTFTHSPIALADLESLAPTEEWIAWLDRDGVYPECGFYIINCRHPRHAELIEAFERMYSEDRLFALAEYHDSFVLEHVVRSAGVPAKSLSGEGYRTTHPLVNGPLSRWLDHMKGRRKLVGRTPSGERLIRDGVAYWS